MHFPTISAQATDEDKQESLNCALEILSLSQISDRDDLNRALSFFVWLYKGDFRHKYSDIYIKMCSPDLEIDKAQERCACLSENLRLLVDGDLPAKMQDAEERHSVEEQHRELCQSSGFFKLRDHVDLEARRTLAESGRLNNLSDMVGNTASDMKVAKEELDKARDELDAAKNIISHLQRETVAVLGVFAAVVLVFNGSIGFSTSAIQAVGLVPSTRSVMLVCILVGFVMFNSIAVLLKFVWGITGHGVKPIRESQSSQREAKGKSSEATTRSCIWPYVLVPDALLALLFVLVVSGVISLPDAAMPLSGGV